ncbi:MAG: outer membrane beta-barrel protein [Methylophilus sp.]|nr:outer membrane beta-barrel protein [Methylophilus sp.]
MLLTLSDVALSDDFNPQWYAGVALGYAKSKQNLATATPYVAPGFTTTSYWADTVNPNNVSNSGSGQFSSDNAMGGAYAGFSSSFNPSYFWGLETGWLIFSATHAGLQRTTYPAFSGFDPRTSIALKQNDIGYFVGKLGLSQDDWKLSVKGGAAISRLKLNLNFTDDTASIAYQKSGYRLGWATGIGLEKSINTHWSVRADYMYTNFGSVSAGSNGLSDGANNYTQSIFNSSYHVSNNLLSIGLQRNF